MRLFRDVIAAILVGILGGFFVTTVSYYNQHKEGGLLQTAAAITNSFDTVARAYGGTENSSLFSSFEEMDITAPETADKVLETLGDMDYEDADAAQKVLKMGDILKAVLGNTSDMESDVIAMEGEDGNIDQGMPYSGILRFHVRANSDSEEDQELKMAVKEDVVNMLKPLLADCKDVEESKQTIISHFADIYVTAIHTIEEQGYDYKVKVYVTEEEFPAKTYGDLTFPEGKYQALRIDIGEAKGQNWWCVMYPPLCFIDGSTAVVSEEGKELLKENLTVEEYQALLQDEDTKYCPRLKLVELWEAFHEKEK